MSDLHFDATVIYIFDVDARGAAGVILNRPTDIRIADALAHAAAAAAEPAVVFRGGPVRTEQALVLAADGVAVAVIDTDDIGSFRQGSIRVFAGYAGWSLGQLEAEIDEGAWFVAATEPGDITTPQPGNLWRAVYGRQEGPSRRYRTFPDDPSLN